MQPNLRRTAEIECRINSCAREHAKRSAADVANVDEQIGYVDQGLSPAVPREESERVLRHWGLRSSLQTPRVTGGGEGVSVGLTLFPSGRRGVTNSMRVFLRENAMFFRRRGLPEVYRCFTPRKVRGEGVAVRLSTDSGPCQPSSHDHACTAVRAALCSSVMPASSSSNHVSSSSQFLRLNTLIGY